jgi:hypothetical protein
MRKHFISSVKKRGKSKGATANSNPADNEGRPYISGHGDATMTQQSLHDSQSVMNRKNVAHTTMDALEITETISNEHHEYSEQKEADAETAEFSKDSTFAINTSPGAVHEKDSQYQSDFVSPKQIKHTAVHRSFVSQRRRSGANKLNRSRKSEEKGSPHLDDPNLCKLYETIPELDVTILPRGGTSIETEAVGRIQVCLSSIGKHAAV